MWIIDSQRDANGKSREISMALTINVLRSKSCVQVRIEGFNVTVI